MEFYARIPSELKSELFSIKLELVSMDEIRVPAGKFQAYHFKSIPISLKFGSIKMNARVPLK